MWLDIEQNSRQWFNLRLGKATSSNFAKIMANDGKAFGEPAKNYAKKVALEIITGERDSVGDVITKLMERGTELEPVAIDLYQAKSLNWVTNGGFCDCGRYGDSPDGYILDDVDGCVEVKTVVANTQWERYRKKDYDTSYKWQIQAHMWLGNKKWCDFISYCPEFPESKQLYIYRVERDEEMITRMVNRLEIFDAMVDANIKLLGEDVTITLTNKESE